MKDGSNDAADCMSEGADDMNNGAKGHESAQGDYQGQQDAMADDFKQGANWGSKCFNKGADDFQKGFSGRK